MSDDDNGIKLDFIYKIYRIMNEFTGGNFLSNSDGENLDLLDEFYNNSEPKDKRDFFNNGIYKRDMRNLKNIQKYLEEIEKRAPNSEKYKDSVGRSVDIFEFKGFIEAQLMIKAENNANHGVSNTATDDTTYVYDDVLASHDLSSETNEDKAIEILLKAITETIFMIMDDMFLYILNCERYINESASMSDEIPQDSLEKSRGIINRAKNRMYELAQMLIVSCPEQWKQEFNDKYIVLGNSEPDLDSIVFDS